MDREIIIFSGMPASGKDTITARLCETDRRFAAFKKHRSVGAGDIPKSTYINIPAAEFEQKIQSSDFLQYHERYGRYYGIDEKALSNDLQNGLCPIIHIGRIHNYFTFRDNITRLEKNSGISVKLFHILLWETADVLRDRIIQRNKTESEIKKRMDAVSQEFADNIEIMNKGEKPFDLIIRNKNIEETVRKIKEHLQNKPLSADDGYSEFWDYLRSLGEQNDRAN